jgi:bifunctional ADP-heptose synthase (sugar kinase/adenylyltransferase)
VVKGDDYSPEAMPEAEIVEGHGGRVVILSKVPGYSTTRIAERMADVSHAG